MRLDHPDALMNTEKRLERQKEMGGGNRSPSQTPSFIYCHTCHTMGLLHSRLKHLIPGR